MIKKLFSLFVCICLLGINVQGQYASPFQTTIPFSIQSSNSFLQNNQCIDGGQQVVKYLRLYTNDIYYPMDSALKLSDNTWIDWFRYDQSQITLYNGSNSIFQNLAGNGGFSIISYGAKDQNQKVYLTKHYSGLQMINNNANPLSQSSQLVYNIKRQGLDKQTAGSINLSQYFYFQVGGTSYQFDGPYNNLSATAVVNGTECVNVYSSYCGDGYIDQGNPSTGGTSTKPGYVNHPTVLAKGSAASEVCDPGSKTPTSNPSDYWTDDVLPGGVTPTATNYCKVDCSGVENVTQNTTLTITKEQRNETTSIPSNGAYQSSAVSFSANDSVWFKITVSTTSPGAATNVVLTDTLPVGFVMSANGVTVDGALVSNPTVVAQQFSLSLGTMTHPQTKTIIVKGTMTNASNTTSNYYKNTASVSYATPNNPNASAGPVVVYQNPTSTPPSLTIDKEQRLYPNGSWVGIGNPNLAPLSYTSPQDFEFKITITNTSTSVVANNVVLEDELPRGFSPITTPLCISSVPGVVCNDITAPGGWFLVRSTPFSLNPGAQAVFTFRGTLVDHYMVGSVWFTGQNTFNIAKVGILSNPSNANSSLNNIITDTVQQNPTPQSPVLSLKKYVKNATTASARNDAENNNSTATSVMSGDAVMYRIDITRTGGPLGNAILTDAFPLNGGFVITGFSVGTISNPGVVYPTSASAWVNGMPNVTPTLTSLLNAGGAGPTTVYVYLYGSVSVSTTPTSNSFVNYATVYDATNPLITSTNQAWTYIPGPPPSPILDIQKTYKDTNGNWVDSITRNPGQSFEMQLVVTNNGSATATQVYVSDQCDPRITCSSWVVPSTSFGSTITNNLLQTPNIATAYGALGLLPGGTITIYVYGTVNASAEGTTVPNTGYVYMAPGFTTPVDSDPAEIVSPALQKSFSITKSVTGTFVVGNTLTYTLSLCNNGQGNISSYTITDPLPMGLTYVNNSTNFTIASVTTLAGNPTNNNNILTRGCGLTPNVLPSSCLLAPNQCATLTFSTTVSSITPSFAAANNGASQYQQNKNYQQNNYNYTAQ